MGDKTRRVSTMKVHENLLFVYSSLRLSSSYLLEIKIWASGIVAESPQSDLDQKSDLRPNAAPQLQNDASQHVYLD